MRKDMKIISIYNNKGGVGKTTTTKRLAIYLSNMNKKVLIIDMDPQTNISKQFLNSYKEDITDVLLTGLNINEAIYTSDKIAGNIHIVPASMSLQKANNKMLLEGIEQTPATRLNKALKKLEDDYDYILIDCPATIDLLVTNALVVADEIIIPMGTDVYSLEGIKGLVEKINEVKQNYNNELKIKGIFLNRFKNSNIHKEMFLTLKKLFKERVLETKIGDYAIINENTFIDNEKQLLKHKVNEQFKTLFEELGY